MAEWLHFPARWLDVSKSSPDGSVEGYASVFNVIDQQDDVVVPGAFKRSLAFWKQSSRRIPLVADHVHSSEGLIGSIGFAAEDPFGLRFRAEFSASKSAQDVRLKAKEKHLDGVSIFGDIKEKSVEMVDGRPIRVLKEIGLIEISLTPFPANTRALVSAVKGANASTEDVDLDLLDEAWVADMRAALTISSAPIRKSAVDALVVIRHNLIHKPVETSATADGDRPDGETSDDQDEAAKFALDLIGESGPGESPPGGDPSHSLAELLASQEAVNVSAELDDLMAQLGNQQ